MISTQDIEKIKDSSKIEEVVGDFVQLKTRGSNKLGLCPFHNEKTPSFTVSPTKGIYKCFGCGKSGNSISFVMEHEQFSFPEALRYLAEKYNIELNEVVSEEAKAQRNLYESLYIINNFAQKHFAKNLMETDEGRSVGLSYFKDRGFLDISIEKFQLGYSMDSYDTLIKESEKGSYREEYLIKLGLIGNKNGRKYDFFRGRVMFPIHNLSGKVIGFGARTLSKDKKVPKYVNSPESEIYYKSKILYGAYQAKHSISKLDNCFLTEGYTDVVSMHQAGIENVVASSGTSLTVDQIQLIKRFTKNVTVLYDGDMAGINAALRGTDMILEADMNVRVVLLPDGQDPDSYVQANGAEGFKEFVDKESKDFVFFKTELLLSQAQGDPVKKTELIRSIVDTLTRIPDPIKRALYIRECSQLLKISEEIIINETNKVRHKKVRDYQSKRDTQNNSVSNSGQQGNFQPSQQSQNPQDPQDFRGVPNFPDPDSIGNDSHNATAPAEEVPVQKKDKYSGAIQKLECEAIELLLDHAEKPLQKRTVLEYSLDQLDEVGGQLEHPTGQTVWAMFRGQWEKNQNILQKEYFLNHHDQVLLKFCTDLEMNKQETSTNWKKMYQIPVKTNGASYADRIVNLWLRYKQLIVQRRLDENQEIMRLAKTEEEITNCIKVNMHLLNYQKILSKELGLVIPR